MRVTLYHASVLPARALHLKTSASLVINVCTVLVLRYSLAGWDT